MHDASDRGGRAGQKKRRIKEEEKGKTIGLQKLSEASGVAFFPECVFK